MTQCSGGLPFLPPWLSGLLHTYARCRSQALCYFPDFLLRFSFTCLLCVAVRGGSSNRTTAIVSLAVLPVGLVAGGSAAPPPRWVKTSHELLTTTLTLFRQLNGIRWILGDLSTDASPHQRQSPVRDADKMELR